MIEPENTLKVALVGCGRVGARTTDRFRKTAPKGWLPFSHAEAIQSTENLELIAICDVDDDRLSWAGTTYMVNTRYTDYKRMIREVKPDILSIATRTAGRCEIIEFAAEHGVRGIHAEKPISRNMADCKRALDAVARNGVKLTYGTARRFMETYRKAKEIVLSGRIGDIMEIRVEHGKTMLMWNHPHSADLLLFFSDCQDIEYVQAICTINPQSVRDNYVDDDPILENAFVKFTNGINGIITSASGMNTRISGTLGQLTVVADGSWIEIHQKTSEISPYHLHTEKFEVVSEMSVTQKIFSELETAVRDNQELPIQLGEIALGQNILFCFVLSSLRSGMRLRLSDLNENFTVTGKIGPLYA